MEKKCKSFLLQIEEEGRGLSYDFELEGILVAGRGQLVDRKPVGRPGGATRCGA